MNVFAYQEENKRICKKGAGEKKERQTISERDRVLSFCGRSECSMVKNDWLRGVPGVTETFRKATAISTHSKWCQRLHHHVEAADWCWAE